MCFECLTLVCIIFSHDIRSVVEDNVSHETVHPPLSEISCKATEWIASLDLGHLCLQASSMTT